jgi:transcriptional regulator with XRE-family HTH domain
MEREHILKKFGERVRYYRHDKGVSQEEFAYLCGFHRTYIGAIERGERNPALISILKIAKGLEISPVKLLEGIAL